MSRSQILPETLTLEQEAIPHPAMPDCTHHFFLAKMLREAEFNSTRFVQALPLFGGEFQIQTGELVLELRMGLQASATCAMPRPVCSATDFTAEMIGAARCSPGRNSFITSLVIRPPSALPSP